MLLFNEKLLKVRRINQIITPVYEDEEKQEGLIGYMYSDLATYQQAITLMVRFEGEITALLGLLNIKQDNMSYIEYYKNRVPMPFKMFAPYLGLVESTEPLKEDLVDLVSHLHVIGRSISFSDFVTVPAAARINVSFGKTSFLTMNSDIKDYTVGLYETERAESPDSIYWINSDEVERVGSIAKALSEAFGGITLGNASQTAVSFNNTSNSTSGDSSSDDILAEINRETADFEDTFDPAEWEGFVPIQSSEDFSAFNLKTSNESPVTSATPTSTAQQESYNEESTQSIVNEDEYDEDDLLTRMAAGMLGNGI